MNLKVLISKYTTKGTVCTPFTVFLVFIIREVNRLAPLCQFYSRMCIVPKDGRLKLVDLLYCRTTPAKTFRNLIFIWFGFRVFKTTKEINWWNFSQLFLAVANCFGVRMQPILICLLSWFSDIGIVSMMLSPQCLTVFTRKPHLDSETFESFARSVWFGALFSLMPIQPILDLLQL